MGDVLYAKLLRSLGKVRSICGGLPGAASRIFFVAAEKIPSGRKSPQIPEALHFGFQNAYLLQIMMLPLAKNQTIPRQRPNSLFTVASTVREIFVAKLRNSA